MNKQPENSQSDRVLTISRVFDAPRALVFRAWADPQHLARWWGPRGYSAPRCEMDFRPGGAYRILMRSGEGREVVWQGVCREIVEPERLVLTAKINEAADGALVSSETVLTVTFADEAGKTRLTLHQEIFDSVENRDAHQSGWSEALERLGDYVVSL